MYNNKVVLSNGTVLIDLTGDTIVASALLSGYTAHDMAGAPIVGSCTFDVDSTDATVAASEMLEGKVGYARGARIVGTMPNKGAVIGTIATVSQKFVIPYGCHDGSGYCEIDTTEQLKIIASNIKSGVEILGVVGSYAGEAISLESKEVTPNFEGFTVLPSDGKDGLSQVTVKPIPYTETENAAGGITVTIG